MPQSVVQNDDMKDVQKLALVFVNAFDLAVKDRVGIDDLTRGSLEPVGECNLGLAFRVAKLLAEAGVVGQGQQIAELRQVADPVFADLLA